MSYKIYAHVNKINGKVYVGQTSQNVNKRWRNGNGYVNNIAFYRAIQKYGWDNFEHEILFDGLTKEQADIKEKEMIAFYDSNNPDKGYNLTDGGQGTNGYRMPEERKRQISEFQKGRLLTDEWKRHISESVRGENHPFWGKKLSDEHRRHLSEAHMGQKPAYGMLGKKLSQESRDKISKALTGHPTSNETRKKIGLANGRLTRCIDTEIVYYSATEASRQTGCNVVGITRCCNGTQQTCGGLHWEWADAQDISI